MKKLIIAILVMTALALFPALSWAAQATAQAQVSAVIPSLALLSLETDQNSDATNPNQILFDKLDSEDMPGGDAAFMYAPYRSRVGKNWHVADIAANGSSMVLSLSVTGSIGTKPLSDILKVWCGGFFGPGDITPISGTPSTDWEFANGWQRSLGQPFTGTSSFNYQLNIGEVSAGSYAGLVTFTLVTN